MESIRAFKDALHAPDSRCEIAAVDLFCGAGGLTKGLEAAGIDVRLGVDIDPACCFPYEQNNKARFLQKSVDELNAKTIADATKGTRFRLVAGCAPCQPFSTYTQGKSGSNDRRWPLLRQFARLVKETLPDCVTMENVPQIEDQVVFIEFVEGLRLLGYRVDHTVVECNDYGVPQQRRRLVLLASRLGPISLAAPDPNATMGPRTVRDAIETLAPLKAGEVDPVDPLHQCCSLAPINLERIRASRPGGSWRDWNSDLVAACHKKETGKTYPSVYGRMTWDDPAPTMTTQFYAFGSGRFGHPEQDRAISIREGAILQSFPPDYIFVRPGDPFPRKTIGRLIGNAVPVKLGEAIGKSIVQHICAYI